MIEPAAPTPETITRHIVATFPDVDIVTAGGGTFFSIDPVKHWPNFATLVTTDEFDASSNLSRPDVFRLNIGVSRETFERLVGSPADPDYTAFDRLLPHPVYARQRWLCILNPSESTFESVVKPLLAEAHDRLAAQRKRHAQRREIESS